MPFIDVGTDFKNAKETPLAPEAQYDLRCGAAEVETDKDRIVIPIEFESGEYRPMRHFVNLPRAKDIDRDNERGVPHGTTTKNKQLMIKRFCYLFQIPYTDTGFDTDDVAGARARATVTTTPTDDRGNSYNQVVLPRLPEEAE